MPMIECTIERDGPTTINDGGFTFVFKENDAGHRVCNVLSDGTADRLLNFAWFRKYRPDIDYADKPESQAPGKAKQDDDQTADEESMADVMLELHGEGMSLRAIGEQVGKSKDWVAREIKRLKQEA